MADHVHDIHNDSDKTLEHPHYTYHQRYLPTCSEMNSPWASPHNGVAPQQLLLAYEPRKFANPSPLGLCAFAVTTFVLSCETTPNIAVPLAFSYEG